jgi:hypothetical protein
MRRCYGAIASLLAATVLCACAASASAQFGFVPGTGGFEVSTTAEDGSPSTLSGSHPYEFHLDVAFNKAGEFTDGDLRNIQFELPPGFLLTPTVTECTLDQFHTPRISPYQKSLSGESCPNGSQVGTVAVHSSFGGGTTRWFGVFNLTHPHGVPMAVGFSPFGNPTVVPIRVREDGSLTMDIPNLSQEVDIDSLEITLWGTPWASPEKGFWTFAHDNERGNCLNEEDPNAHFGQPAQPIGIGASLPSANPPGPPFIPGTCTVGGDPRTYVPPAFVALPTSCEPMHWKATASSWKGQTAEATAPSPDGGGEPVSPTNCVGARSVAEAHLFTQSAAAPTGLIFNVHTPDSFPFAAIVRFSSPPRAATMSLPEGLTINPSLAAGLGYCTEEQYAREGIETPPDGGCPENSKIGSVTVDGLLGLTETIKGSVYLAQPYANKYRSLVGVYVVLRNAERGIFWRSVGHVEPDPATGRLQVTFEDLPQLQYARFGLTLREGQRAALVSPPSCGTFISELDLTPYSDASARVHDLSYMEIVKGEHDGPCPTGALPPFHPGLVAGSLNPFAGALSPFFLHMTRDDGEQEITSYSASFPPGFLGKVAGIAQCPDSAIEAAKTRTGTEELQSPSCPAASQVGHTLAGYGVGATLAYAPGNMYLSGPYHGSPISLTAIDSAIVGPFDLGVVVVRSAIRVDHRTAQASIDSSGSDPIPHILKGIPLHLRDIRVYVDRPGFTINPTSCDEQQTVSRLTGAAHDLYSSADDVSALSTDRYQLLGCPDLPYRPRFGLGLRGKSRRGGFPSLRAVYRPENGDANIKAATVALPHTEFLAQGHLREICSQVQFSANSCPTRSVYGHARVFTPLLSEPLEGPVYLRSSPAHPLPDMVIVLQGPGELEVDLVGKIDSTKSGGMRVAFSALPDAPVSKFVMTLLGGDKGLLENSANMCASRSFALARLIAHNNKGQLLPVKMNTKCGHRRQRQKSHRGARHRQAGGRR